MELAFIKKFIESKEKITDDTIIQSNLIKVSSKKYRKDVEKVV